MSNLLAFAINEYNIMVYNSMIICLIFFCSLFICHARHWTNIFRNPLFYVYFFAILTTISEFTWLMIDGIKSVIWLNYIISMISLGGVPLIGIFWLFYCFQFFPNAVYKKLWVKLLFAFPALVDLFLIILSPVIEKMFFIDENGWYVRGPWFFLQGMGYVYVIVGSLIAMLNIKKATLSVEKTHLRILGLTALPCILISGVQFFLPAGGLPYFQYSMLLYLSFIFVHDEERRITVDPLTRLKTRYEFEKTLSDKIKKIKSSVDKKLYVIAGDINEFKDINDNFGHNEGDIAIRTVGDIMDKVSTSHKAVAGRRSGDEFLIVVEGNNISIAKEITKCINDELEKVNATHEYNLILSFGIAEYDGKETLIQLVNKADKLMYQEKEIYKSKKALQ